MPWHNTSAIGRGGEWKARKFLEEKGYEIVRQNYRTKYGEIDLVAKHGDTLVFIEVRTKTNDMHGLPEETVNRKKLWKLHSNARAYLMQTRWEGLSRIDVISLLVNPKGTIDRIAHYENV